MGEPAVPGRLAELGWNERWAALAADRPPGTEPGRVVRHDGIAVLVATAHRVGARPLRPALPPLAVGDWLLVDDHSVVAVLERTALLQRRDPTRGGPQLIAANVDLVGVVCGLDRPVKRGRIQRFVVQVFDSGARPLVVLTKVDLVGAPETIAAEAIVERAAPGVDAICTSVRSGAGLRALRDATRGRTVAFVGESGAGKSTLVNVLAGRDVAATTAVRSTDAKGRHTTTARELHVLPGHGCLVDTPGLREVGLFTDVATVDEVFDDVVEALALAEGPCRFTDCTHTSEPGCAVRAAVESGALDPQRYESWLALRREAEAAELRADPVERRRTERRFSKMAREAQKRSRRD